VTTAHSRDQAESDSPETVQTSRSLISRLRNLDDRDSWQDFFETYWKLIYSFARKAGLTEQEAEAGGNHVEADWFTRRARKLRLKE
jgi:hypothetical protein